MDITEYIASRGSEVDREIEKVIPRNKEPQAVYGVIWDLLGRGGKRFRPVMCMLSCEAVGGDSKKLLPIAASIEMFHNFTLSHDDIEDDSEMRRGKPCLHKIYGVPLAVNAGDGLFAMVWETSLLLEMSPKKIFESQKILSDTFRRVLEGQGIEIEWYRKNTFDVTEEDYLNMVAGKTGALIAASCDVGAFLGGGKKRQRRILREFGNAVGIAFQIQDDVLNIVGKEEKYGKEIGGDISEGKRTLLVIHTLSKASPEDRKKLISILSERTKDQSKVREAIELLKKHNSPEYARKRAEDIVKKAKKGLEKLPQTDAREKLLQLADFFINREF
ncbi:MAG: Geranylgeranyl diphosphate synthase [Candidatus Fermentimicrarchaeum limneticum]|uniref:Geranylgeranyl diphosphate synthase n=1 Tax=Fermentimicrarchaeum limneticum TaxID=2795018 RepID=A0A7D6BG86_FERL1|nr:MAG: Geranylgeranyl diphosphate synthase [Candidatus Fermentimicrarchaeum limneticum]